MIPNPKIENANLTPTLTTTAEGELALAKRGYPGVFQKNHCGTTGRHSDFFKTL
ncbi:MAG: hypothetical protein Ctma_0960 [Catillopecten margaritatus gill symbiont]|uniref:Uncharacterized protein n=1 Tax=Catillopecten margaritatus gill symbiont TaxID=3083288 RepID=A0AAU6PHM4_9GAMM